MSASALANGWLEEMPLSFGSGIFSDLLASGHSVPAQGEQGLAQVWAWPQQRLQSLREVLSAESSDLKNSAHALPNKMSGHRQLLSQALSLESATAPRQSAVPRPASSMQQNGSSEVSGAIDPRPGQRRAQSFEQGRSGPEPSVDQTQFPEKAWSPRLPLFSSPGLNLSQLLFPDLSQAPAEDEAEGLPANATQREPVSPLAMEQGEAIAEKPLAAKALQPNSQKRATLIPGRAALNYFSEVAFTGEFSQTVPMIRKWEDDIRIRVHGHPSAADLKTLTQVAEELNGLIKGVTITLVNAEGLVDTEEGHTDEQATPISAAHAPETLNPGTLQPSTPPSRRTKLEHAKSTLEKNHLSKRLDRSTPLEHDDALATNFDIFFVPESQFSRYEPSYLPTNYGFFWAWSDEQGYLRKAKVLISSTSISQRERSHLIREELTQALGLMQDSFSHKDSIFYQDWTATTKFSALDQQLIQMLYRPDILPGMSQRQALKVLQSP